MRWQSLIILVLLIALAIACIDSCNKSKRLESAEDKASLYVAANDTLKRSVNELTGDVEYSKQALAAFEENLEDYIRNNPKHPVASIVKGNKAGIVATSEVIVDTIVRNTIDTVYDTRTANINNEHYTAKVVSTKDSTSVSFKATTTVKYSIDDNYRLTGAYSNPYVNVIEQESFYVKPPAQKKKNWKYWIGAIAGGALIYGIIK